MATHPRKVALANALGTLGYISIIFQWLWCFIILANPLLSSDMHFLIPTASAPVSSAPSTPPSPFVIGIVVALTVLIFIMTLYALWKLPRTIGNRAGHATKYAANALIPLVTHHHAPTKKERHRLSWRLIVTIKLILVLIPTVALLWASPVGTLTHGIILIVGIFCASCSLFYFGLQWMLVRVWKLPSEHIW